MDPNKTFDERAPFTVDDEAVDPEDQETVLFGQRHLFHDVDLAAAKRQQGEAQTARQRARQRRVERASEADVADTVVTSRAADAGTDPVVVRRDNEAKSRKRPSDAESWEAESERVITEEVPAEELAAVHDEAETVELSGSETKREAKPEQRKKEKTEPAAGRQVAERRPADAAPGRHKHRRTSDMSSSCRMCGKSVNWPKARRFRGRKSSAHGFRCDTCGNVFCAEHVLRNSGFWESLLHHGRFRCLLCALGQMAKQAEQVRVRAHKGGAK